LRGFGLVLEPSDDALLSRPFTGLPSLERLRVGDAAVSMRGLGKDDVLTIGIATADEAVPLLELS
jgi:hypothetical protein